MLRIALCLLLLCAAAAAQEHTPRIESRDLSAPGTSAAPPPRDPSPAVVDAQPLTDEYTPPPPPPPPPPPIEAESPPPKHDEMARPSTAPPRSSNRVAAFWIILPSR